MEAGILFENISDLRFLKLDEIGPSIVVAPHPDDETLGCGGTAALLLKAGFSVHFLFISDGTLSHPNSRKFPKSRLRELRESEACDAVCILGATENAAEFLAFPDRSVPDSESVFFESAVRLVVSILTRKPSQTIFIPWENDPHPDHKATWQIFTEAVRRLEVRPRILQYPIWLWEMGEEEDLLAIGKMKKWSVDITDAIEIKRNALMAHQSQVSDLIDDDPDGFRLSEKVISHFDSTTEIFFES